MNVGPGETFGARIETRPRSVLIARPTPNEHHDYVLAVKSLTKNAALESPPKPVNNREREMNSTTYRPSSSINSCFARSNPI